MLYFALLLLLPLLLLFPFQPLHTPHPPQTPATLTLPYLTFIPEGEGMWIAVSQYRIRQDRCGSTDWVGFRNTSYIVLMLMLMLVLGFKCLNM